MKTRISAIVCLLCVVGCPLFASAETELPTMPSGTYEPYMSIFAGVGIPFSQDATFQDGTSPTVVKDVDYQMKQSWGGSAGIWFPTRDKLAGFDLGVEITGYVWYPDVACCRDFYNNNPPSGNPANGPINNGTTTEVAGVYVGPNFLVRYPVGISEAYPNGRWHPYVGVGVGAHQMGMKPGGARGVTLFNVDTTQRDTTIGFQAVGGVKAHLFKYVAAFAEAKYLYAHHNGLSSDRYGNSPQNIVILGGPGPFANPYSSTVDTILVHAGLSLHFNWEPPDWGQE
jgi:opacity protein-like surface antigen